MSRSVERALAHRYSTMFSADRIYITQSSRIIETGTHDPLIATVGLYSAILSLQARAYR